MTNVVRLAVARQERTQTQEALWQRFVDLMQHSKDTLRLEDGIAAQKAYRAFLEFDTRATK